MNKILDENTLTRRLNTYNVVGRNCTKMVIAITNRSKTICSFDFLPEPILCTLSESTSDDDNYDHSLIRLNMHNEKTKVCLVTPNITVYS